MSWNVYCMYGVLLQVSDGQRRRVQLLLSLVKPFKILLLDEVTTSLGKSQARNRAESVQYILITYPFGRRKLFSEQSMNLTIVQFRALQSVVVCRTMQNPCLCYVDVCPGLVV